MRWFFGVTLCFGCVLALNISSRPIPQLLLCMLVVIIPSLLVSTIVYGEGNLRAFAIGALVPSLTFLISSMFDTGVLEFAEMWRLSMGEDPEFFDIFFEHHVINDFLVYFIIGMVTGGMSVGLRIILLKTKE